MKRRSNIDMVRSLGQIERRRKEMLRKDKENWQNHTGRYTYLNRIRWWYRFHTNKVLYWLLTEIEGLPMEYIVLEADGEMGDGANLKRAAIR